MNKRTFGFVALLALQATLGLAAGPAYRVVVNSANPATSMTRDDVAKLFLKKTTAWPSGQAVSVVDQGKESAVRKAFSRGVLNKDVPSVESYWQQQIFSGRAVPPAEKGNDADVLGFVRANAGAIGYVSGAAADLGASVKELTVN
jgi:ABC-type phosphate transport system substrate-binding protein